MFDFGSLTRTITSTGLFGEWITYVKASGATRTIRAGVKRVPAQALPETGETLRPYMEVTVEANATSGISLAELETSTDALKIPVRVGGTADTLAISKILRQAPGLLVLEVV